MGNEACRYAYLTWVAMWDRFFRQRAYIWITRSRMLWYVRKATRGRLLIFGAWLYSFETEGWIVVSQEKTQRWIFSDLSRPSTWFKSKTGHFYLKPLINALNMLSALRLTYLTCWTMRDWMHREEELWRCKNNNNTHTHFPQQNYLLELLWLISYINVVLVNPFWLNNHLFIF